MRSLLVAAALIVLAGLSAATGAAENPATVTLNVSNMTCSLCPVTVRKALEGVPGVVSAKADLETQTAVVRYDPTVTNPRDLMRATSNAGFPSAVKR